MNDFDWNREDPLSGEGQDRSAESWAEKEAEAERETAQRFAADGSENRTEEGPAGAEQPSAGAAETGASYAESFDAKASYAEPFEAKEAFAGAFGAKETCSEPFEDRQSNAGPFDAGESWHTAYGAGASETGRDPLGAFVRTGAGEPQGEYHYAYRGADACSAAPQYRQSEPEQKVKTKKKSGFGKRAIALALCCALLGAGAGFGGGILAGGLNKTSRTGAYQDGTMVVSTREPSQLSVAKADTGKLLTAAEVYAQNVNSTVGITTEITTTNWWGYQSTSAAAGSGFILTDNGYILTNYHVVEGANSVTVAMYDGSTYPADLIGYDKSNDIAVLKIDAEGLTPVVLGSSDDLVVGQDVVAIGNPLGELTFSLTRGAVSALNRTVSLSNNVTMELIQTDCAINAGNSGGALFNLYGEVVGITNAKYSSSSSSEASIDNIGFAIPINTVRSIVTSIIEKGYISKPYIGVSIDNVGSESQSYGMPQGAAIRSVESGSPAEEAGLQANDIVTAVNGQKVTGYADLADAVTKAGIGAVLELEVYRKGETLTLKVTVGEKIQSANGQSTQSSQGGQNQSGQGGQDQSGQSGFPWGWGFGG